VPLRDAESAGAERDFRRLRKAARGESMHCSKLGADVCATFPATNRCLLFMSASRLPCALRL